MCLLTLFVVVLEVSTAIAHAHAAKHDENSLHEIVVRGISQPSIRVAQIDSSSNLVNDGSLKSSSFDQSQRRTVETSSPPRATPTRVFSNSSIITEPDSDLFNSTGFRSDEFSDSDVLAVLELGMHEVGTVQNRDIAITGVNGCAALFLFGATPGGGRFITAAHVVIGLDPINERKDVQTIRRARREARETGVLDRISIATPDDGTNLKDFVEHILNTIKLGYDTSPEGNQYSRIPVEILLYPWNFDTELEWDFLASRQTNLVRANVREGPMTVSAQVTTVQSEIGLPKQT